MSNLLKQVANLSPEKRELLLQRLNKKGQNRSQPQIKRQSRESNTFPLSFAQARLWFLNQLEPDSAAYNIPTVIRLKGSLNVTALAQSLNEVIQRHEVLRTSFTTVGGQPVQAIAPNLSLILPRVDLQQLSETQQRIEVLRLATQEAQQPFSLDKGPLLRVTLVQLDEADHIVLFTMHHIVSDGWSTGVLVRELAALYGALAKGQPISHSQATQTLLPELPIQYADFAVWQRQWLQGEVLASQLAYWKQHLGGTLPVLELPTDRPRPALQTNRGATQSFALPKELSEALKSLGRQEETTLFMTLLAAFMVLLHRYTQQGDIAIGTSIANRNRSETEGLIGFFVNTLVLRTQLTGNPRFRQFLKHVREVALGAYAHQDLPFEQLVEELQPERDLSHNSLFQVMFILQNAPTEDLKLPGLTLSTLKVESGTASFDLTLSMVDAEQGLKGTLEYNTDLFEAARIDRMLQHFQVLLEGIVTNPDHCLSDLPILTPAEQQQLLVEWNQTQAVSTKNQCIHQLFEAQVEQTPDAVAVVFADQHLTYQVLNQRANQLAHYLRKLEVGPEVLVGVSLERSLEMIIGLLGILKAGGAYVPLDPTYPQERVAFMLADAQVPVLLTQAHLVSGLPEDNTRIVRLDEDWSLIAQESQNNPVNHAVPENLAYVIYTSGSTGQPKGVMIQHRSLVNHTESAMIEYNLAASDRILQFASISFDAAAEEIFSCLVQGATLILRTQEMLSTVSGFLQQCQELKLTMLDLPTAFWHQLTSELAKGLVLPESLRLVIIGGESALPEYLAIWQQVGAQVRLINSYGPTEATIVATTYDLSGSTAVETVGQAVPIGQPIRNLQTYVLDPSLNPTPVGIPGELYIGGVGLARGYLNRPELTAEKFIPSPFSRDPGTRLYKTGDRVRYRSDGNIEFLGRIDQQVKIRGFRIELGEIEAALGQHAAVQEVVVMMWEDMPGQNHLVAYVVLDRKQAPTVNELRSFLQGKLPDYMVPFAFVTLETLPLTPNGKVDRRSLPAPDRANEISTVFVTPRTLTEEKLVAIWVEVLSLDQVSVHDNFFELGGHSLLMTQLLTRVRDTFKIDLSLRSLFEAPTVAGLAKLIELNPQAGFPPSSNKQTLVDWEAESALDPTVYPETAPDKPATGLASIFLTGATGFLGVSLLYELLQQTQADIYCLLRATSLEEGYKKLRSHLESYLLWRKCFSPRIIPVIGDLSQPLLGFSEEQFQLMAGKFDVIYHNGAWVHHVYPYSILKAANVLGTQEVLRLACRIKTKPVHFISTPSVFSAAVDSEVRVIREQDSLKDSEIPTGGYSQSKWVAEKLVASAQERGLPVCVYRPGRISGHSQTGVFNPNDFLYRLIIGCIQLGSAPDEDIAEDIVPVDYASRAIVHLSKREKSPGKAFHLVNPQLLHSDMLINVIRSFGYPLQQTSYDRWRAELIKVAGHSPGHALYPLVPFFPARGSDRTSKMKFSEKRSNSVVLQFDCRNTHNGLAGTSIICPPIDEQLLSTYLSYLIQNGFLEALQPRTKLEPSLD